MAGIPEQELQQAASLLAAEFPDTPRSVLETALRECYCDIPAARRKLLERQEEAGRPAQRGLQADSYRASTASETAESPTAGVASWLTTGWNQGMRDLGLEQLGAQLSLLGRQVAIGLNSILPDDLNPFGLYDDELEEEEEELRASARDNREDEAAAVTNKRLQNRTRAAGGISPGSGRRFTSAEDEEEEDEDDYDKLN